MLPHANSEEGVIAVDTVVKAVYRRETNTLIITYMGQTLDVSTISQLPIEQWVFPLYSKGTRWDGLYEELKRFTGRADFWLNFDSDDTSYETVKYALQNTPAKLIGSHNTVTIVYSENPFKTYITINGKIFQTDRIQSRSIDEWIAPIHIRGLDWNGIFQELAAEIGTDAYTVYFVGNVEFMQPLMEHCPQSVELFYRDPKMPNPQNQKRVSAPAILKSALEEAKGNPAPAPQSAPSQSKVHTASGGQAALPQENVPRWKAFLNQHLPAIAAVLSLLLLFLPFCHFTAEVLGIKGNVVSVTGFETIFGIKAIKFGTNTSFFAIFLLIIPLLAIVVNYIKQLKRFRKIMILILPVAELLAMMITLLDIQKLFKSFLVEEGMTLKTTPQAGFWIMLILLIACIAYIIITQIILPRKLNRRNAS